MRILMIVLAVCTLAAGLAAGLVVGAVEVIAVTDVVDDDEVGD